LCDKCEIGTYQNVVVLNIPNHMKIENGGYYSIKTTVSIDMCLAEEIKKLWDVEIHTMGCCCGHGKLNGYIQVLTKEDEIRMLELGYKYENKEKRSFIPMMRKMRRRKELQSE
jgi:hypothetical protein